MNKLIVSLIALLISTASFAQVRGTIMRFSGRYLETGRPYSYVALRTLDGSKIGLPSWIDGDVIAKMKTNKAVFEAEVKSIVCTDMSSACLDGRLYNIKSAKITIPGRVARAETFSGSLERHAGRAVESARLYDYISIGQANMAVPSFLNAKELLKLKADLTVVGCPNYMMCTDMSDACGPTEVKPLYSVEIKL